MSRLSITSRGLHQQLVTGIALVSIIPILALWLRWNTGAEEREHDPQVLVYALVAATGLAGYFLLRTSADKVVTLRREVESVVREEGLPQALSVAKSDDILAIRECTDLLVKGLRNEYAGLRSRTAHVERNLERAARMDTVACMVAGMSHDLDNIFTAIHGNADIILRYRKPDPTTEEHVHQIESAANRAVEMMRTIRLCAGRSTFTAKKLDTAEILSEMAATLKESLPPQIAMKYDVAPGTPTITADRQYVRTVIANLVTNAAEAMGDKAGSITVSTGTVRCDRDYLSRAYLDEGLPEGQYVYIDVADAGPGIPSDALEKIFDPFYSGHIRGPGLGLALVMGIVRTHSGTVLVDTSPGKGTTFRVVLPTDETRQELPPGHCSRHSLEG